MDASLRSPIRSSPRRPAILRSPTIHLLASVVMLGPSSGLAAQESPPLSPTLLRGAEAFTEDLRVIHEWVGEAPGDQFGWVARNVGDLDEDGVDDFVTSAPTKALDAAGCGRVYAYSSASGELLWQQDGEAGRQLGNGVGRGLDLDEDGIPDVVVGAPGGPKAGRAYVFSGFDGSVIHQFEGTAPNDGFGLKVCGVADVDGDGIGEVVVGATRDGKGGAGAGRVFVYSGAGGELLYDIAGEAAGSGFGSAVDAQRRGEAPLLAVGAMGFGGTGKAYVYRLGAKQAKPFFTIEPDATSANLGQYFVAMIGDVDGDGTEDVYASDWNNRAKGAGAGRVFVHSGRDGERLRVFDGRRAGEGFGTSPSQAGDVDGDGHADLIVGAWQNADGAPSGGKCYLISGKDGKLLRGITCKQPGDTFGFDATNVGDADGDGAIDLLLTSGWSPARGARTGRVFLIAGELRP